jgi:uncharacterized membrane protein (DUF4010 family)
VRTFPLIGLFAYALALVSGPSMLAPTAGLIVLGALLWLSFQYKLKSEQYPGMTSEVSALLTYVIGLLVHWQAYWIATTLTVLAVALLELKGVLENLTKHVPPQEILTFAKFLLLTAVILPIVPNRVFGSFGFNPRKVWWVVVAASSVSYASYLLLKVAKDGGVLLSGALGGLYSSTATTVILAKRSREQSHPCVYSGAMLVSSGMMYFRFLVLLALLNLGLTKALLPSFLLLGTLGLAGGYAWSRVRQPEDTVGRHDYLPQNPLELSAAFLFGGLFVLLLYLTKLAMTHLGSAGLYTLAALTGVAYPDPFILGLASSAATALPLASAGIIVAAASNNLVKGIYAFGIAERRAGHQALALLAVFAILGLLPLLWRL